MFDNQSHHEEAVSDPNFLPATWALGYSHGLTVDSYYSGRRLAYGASRYVSTNFRCRYRRHHRWHRFGRAEPVAVVVTIGVIAHVVQIAEQERHGGELPDAATGSAWIIIYFCDFFKKVLSIEHLIDFVKF